jgi:hypothetical protein
MAETINITVNKTGQTGPKGEQGLAGETPKIRLTSPSSAVVGLGNKSFNTLPLNADFKVGDAVRITYQASPIPIWMEGVVLSYVPNSGVLGVEVKSFEGSGTLAGWEIRLGGTGADYQPLDSDLTAYAADPVEQTKFNIGGMSLSQAKESRTGLRINRLHAADYGVIYNDQTPAVMTANVSALHNLFAAAVSSGNIAVISGRVYCSGEIAVTGIFLTILGEANAEIVQTDITKNGITMSEVTPPYGLWMQNITIKGQGSATHAMAGIYGRRAGLTYLTSDLNFIDVIVQDFRTGCSFAEIAKLYMSGVSIIGCRYGHDWYSLQTYLLENIRIVAGDSNADATCFVLDGTNYFAGHVNVGEFGGSGFARFAKITQGRLHVNAANMEAFSSAQTIDMPGLSNNKDFSLTNSRIAVTHSATSAVISCQVSGADGNPRLTYFNNNYSGPGRIFESWGTANVGPIIIEGSIVIHYTTTQGGTVSSTRLLGTARNYQTTLPASSSQFGQLVIKSISSGNGPDDSRENLCIRSKDNRDGTGKWSSLVNDMLRKTLTFTVEQATADATEKDLLSFSLHANAIVNDGEGLHLTAWGKTGANANDKTFRFYLGTLAIDFGAIQANNEHWRIDIRTMKGFSGTGQQKVVANLTGGTTIGNRILTAQVSPSNSAAILVRLTAQATALNDVVAHASELYWNRTITTI